MFRDGLYYKKFTNVPFTGELDEGRERGRIEDGVSVGPWLLFYDSGQLNCKGSYNKNGNEEGLWECYWENGQLFTRGEYRDGKMDGFWEEYNPDGSRGSVTYGTYKDNEKISDQRINQ